MKKSIDEADKVVHPVESQRHYEIMITHGFVAQTKEAIGFVRAYSYMHSSGRMMQCRTGYSADYWEEKEKGFGYWDSLEKHLGTEV